jgi:hypothetical protein
MYRVCNIRCKGSCWSFAQGESFTFLGGMTLTADAIWSIITAYYILYANLLYTAGL